MTKRISCIIITLVMIMSMSLPVFADTTAPEVGTFPAKILIDYNKPVIDSNTTQYYKIPEYNRMQLSYGNCAWYVVGRLEEKTAIRLHTNWVFYIDGAQDVVDNIDNLAMSTDIDNIKGDSIAVVNSKRAFHVIYIEYVEYDLNGYPEDVYYTECNFNKSVYGYDPDWDGEVKSMDFDTFVTKRLNGFTHYLQYVKPITEAVA